MNHIKIGRLPADSDAQGVVEPADGSWQLIVDKDGYPHLYVRAVIEPGPDMPEEMAKGEGPVEGMICIEDLLPQDMKIRDLMQASFGGVLSPEEHEAAIAEYEQSRADYPIPCPR